MRYEIRLTVLIYDSSLRLATRLSLVNLSLGHQLVGVKVLVILLSFQAVVLGLVHCFCELPRVLTLLVNSILSDSALLARLFGRLLDIGVMSLFFISLATARLDLRKMLVAASVL